MAPIGSDGQIGADFACALRSYDSDSDYAAVLLDEAIGFGLHLDVETGIAAALLDQEVQEVPLRHEGDEAATDRKMRAVSQGESFASYVGAKLAHLLMRALEELFEEAEFVHQFERGGVDGIAAKVAQEIGVFFEEQDFDACASEEEAKHHAGGPAAYDAAARLKEIGAHVGTAMSIFRDGLREGKLSYL